jgi:hypothetical protein
VGVELRVQVSGSPTSPLLRMLRYLVTSEPLKHLGLECVTAFLQASFPWWLAQAQAYHQRLSNGITPTSEVESFLRFLQTAQPQLLYKPLFSLSAATHPTSLVAHLRAVHSISNYIGRDQLWIKADPQMVVIILMGNTGAKLSKGKGKDGERAVLQVRLGRYACLIELLVALEMLGKSGSRGKATRNFVETIENKLGSLLEIEVSYQVYGKRSTHMKEKEGSLPIWYRDLLCQLFYKMRSITLSTRR